LPVTTFRRKCLDRAAGLFPAIGANERTFVDAANRTTPPQVSPSIVVIANSRPPNRLLVESNSAFRRFATSHTPVARPSLLLLQRIIVFRPGKLLLQRAQATISTILIDQALTSNSRFCVCSASATASRIAVVIELFVRWGCKHMQQASPSLGQSAAFLAFLANEVKLAGDPRRVPTPYARSTINYTRHATAEESSRRSTNDIPPERLLRK